MNAKAPTSDTGIVIVGMMVLRHVCRKMKMTSTTRAIACASVFSTSRMESWTTSVVFSAIWYLRPGGNRSSSRVSSASIALATSSALAVGSWITPNPTAGTP